MDILSLTYILTLIKGEEDKMWQKESEDKGQEGYVSEKLRRLQPAEWKRRERESEGFRVSVHGSARSMDDG